MHPQPGVLRRPQEITQAWLSAVLDGAPIEAVDVEAIGTGQMSESRRVRIAYADGDGRDTSGTRPRSVVVKTASEDEASRSTGVGLGVYDREVRFYSELAPRIGGPLAKCHLAVIDPAEGWFTIVLEDITEAEQGDQIAGCTIADARLAMLELARLHAPVFADPQLGATPWLNQESPLTQALLTQLFKGFVERYSERVADEHLEVCRRLIASLDGWIADRRPPLGLVHGDYRLDNMLFGADAARTGDGDSRFVAVDWPTVGWGEAMTDESYLPARALAVGERRRHAA